MRKDPGTPRDRRGGAAISENHRREQIRSEHCNPAEKRELNRVVVVSLGVNRGVVIIVRHAKDERQHVVDAEYQADRRHEGDRPPDSRIRSQVRESWKGAQDPEKGSECADVPGRGAVDEQSSEHGKERERDHDIPREVRMPVNDPRLPHSGSRSICR